MRDKLGRFKKGHKQPKEWADKRIAAVRKLVGKKSPNWKGDDIGYSGIHDWIIREYGPPNRCENEKCHRKCAHYNWALKRGCEYERKRENFFQLCRSCHNVYDGVGMKKNSRSKYKGVCWHKQIGRWRAYVNFNKKQLHIGVYIDEEMAARAYNKKAIELYGDIAYLNNV